MTISAALRHTISNPPAKIAAIALLLFIAVINAIIPVTDDDLCRANPGLDLSAIVDNAYGEYIGWTGRILPTFLTYAFLSLDWLRPLFPLINGALAALVMVWLPQYHSGRTENWTLPNLVFAWLLMWLLPQSFGYSVFFWTGAIQYLWAFVLALVVLWPYKAWLFGQEGIQSAWRKAGHGVAALLLGSWMEHLAAGMIAMVTLLILYAWIRGQRMPRYLLVGYGLLIAGFVILVAAPGNYVRLGMSGTPLYEIPFTFLLLVTSFLENVVLKFAILGGILYALNRSYFNTLIKQPAARLTILFYGGLAALIAFALIGAGYDEVSSSRAFFPELFLLIPLLTLMPPMTWQRNRRSITFVAALFVMVAGLIQYFYWVMWDQNRERAGLAAEARQTGIERLAVPRYRFFGLAALPYKQGINFGPVFGVDLGTDVDNNKNRCAGRLHGLRSIYVDMDLPPAG